MRKTIIQMDFAYMIYSAQEQGFNLNLTDLKLYLSFNCDVRESIAYVGIDQRNPYAGDYFCEYLSVNGWLVKPKMGTVAGSSDAAASNTELVVEALHHRFVNQIDHLILIGGNSDFVPLVRYLKNYAGVFVCVAAFRDSCSQELLVEANSFIDLDAYYQNYLQRITGGSSQDDEDFKENIKEDPEGVIQ